VGRIMNSMTAYRFFIIFFFQKITRLPPRNLNSSGRNEYIRNLRNSNNILQCDVDCVLYCIVVIIVVVCSAI